MRLAPPRQRVGPSAGAALLALVALSNGWVGSAAAGGGRAAAVDGAAAVARSDRCAELEGMEALYWDYSIGVPRADFPPQAYLTPVPPGGSFFHPLQPLIGFLYPAMWTPVPRTDPVAGLLGVDLDRADGAARWRYRSRAVDGSASAIDALAAEVALTLSSLGATETPAVICSVDAPPRSIPSGSIAFSARLLRFAGFTALVKARVLVAPRAAGSSRSSIESYGAVTRTEEFATLARTTFMPLETQFLLVGGNATPECGDGVDNDGDGAIDQPDDGQCASALDDDEGS